MNTPTLVRGALLALAFTAGAGAVHAQDHYTRLFEMQQMDRNKDGMVSKAEFLAMVDKLWEMHVAEQNMKGKMLNAEQIRALQRVLGRTLAAVGAS